MTTVTTAPRPQPAFATGTRVVLVRARSYFAADSACRLRTCLGLLWLLDGALQLQSYMYGGGFVAMLKGQALMQPGWLAGSVNWAAGVLQAHQVALNTAFAGVQIAIGVGLLHRRTVLAYALFALA